MAEMEEVIVVVLTVAVILADLMAEEKVVELTAVVLLVAEKVVEMTAVAFRVESTAVEKVAAEMVEMEA